ncbi:85_t:CDS:2 [Scutellospora calospora]|uniref:85_t:CDS:1 n=1 Tax=Scutellospora calospora TaxID=85575 RepID=A0ACA9JVV4_9GLOM|nr:85_t:CDS:2 [Scutellospora calospora]
MNGDIVFISGKYVVENSEPYFTIAYSSIIDSSNPNCEFDISDVPINYLGSNIKLQSNYFVSGLLKFSKSDKIMIEATDIDSLKTSTINITRTESSQSATEGAPSIIDIIDNNLDSITIQQHNLFKSSTNANGNVDQSYDTIKSDIINTNNKVN